MMAEDATPLVEAILTIIEAARAYLPPDGVHKDEFITRELDATDNPRVNAALAAHGHRPQDRAYAVRRRRIASRQAAFASASSRVRP